MARGLYFSKALFEGLIFFFFFFFFGGGGAYIRRGLSTEGNVGFKIDWAILELEGNLPFWLCFTLYLGAICQVQAPGGLIFGGTM